MTEGPGSPAGTALVGLRRRRQRDGMTMADDGRAAGIDVAVAPPYEQDGTGVITLTSVRRHTAARRAGDDARGFDAELSGSHPLGAFVVRHGRVHWRPAVDLTRVITTAEIVVGSVLVARRLAARPGSAKAAVVMGPGGWVSMKGGGRMVVRTAGRGWRRRRRTPQLRGGASGGLCGLDSSARIPLTLPPAEERAFRMASETAPDRGVVPPDGRVEPSRPGSSVRRGARRRARGDLAGVAIGVVRLVKGDVGPTSLLSSPSSSAELVLLAALVVRWWRATPGWWRLLGIPAAYLVLQFVLLPVTTAVYATHPPAFPPTAATPADRGLSARDVRLATSDGVGLAAWYLPPHNGAAVVLMHGSGSTRASVLDHAAVLARHGYGVLAVDARGHGASDGTGMELGWHGDQDVGTAVSWLARRPEVGRIGALGLSMGGEEVLGAAASDPRIRAVVAEGALGRGAMDDGWLPSDLQGGIQRIELAVQTAVVRLLTDAPEPISLRRAVAAIAPRPVLLVAGAPELVGDRYLRAAAPGSVDLVELPDTPHTGGLATHPAEWEARVTGFLDRTLIGAG